MTLQRAEAPFPSLTSLWHTTSYPTISSTRTELSAKGKNVIITGGGSGIGAAIAHSFAGAGASRIAILGRTESKLISTRNAINSKHPNIEVVFYIADITSKSSVDNAFATFASLAGPVDILVSNAALGDVGPLAATADVSAWMESIETNLKGSMLVTQAFLRHTIPTEPVIINISSAASFLNLMPGISAYRVSKAAAVSFFDCIQAENPNLRVVNIQPGVVDSEMNRKGGFPALDDASLPGDFCVWLASPEAAFTKGKYLFVNWDVDEMTERKEEIQKEGMLQMWLEGYPHMEVAAKEKLLDEFPQKQTNRDTGTEGGGGRRG